MYLTRFLLAALPILTASNLLAQKVLSEGLIQYDVSVQTGSNQAKMADAFDGASGLVYIKGSQSRTELKSAKYLVTIYDGGVGNGVVIREFGSQKP